MSGEVPRPLHCSSHPTSKCAKPKSTSWNLEGGGGGREGGEEVRREGGEKVRREGGGKEEGKVGEEVRRGRR